MRSSVWDDGGLQRTNPVHVVDRALLDLEPRFAAGDWHRPVEKVPLSQTEFQCVHDHLRSSVCVAHDFARARDVGRRLDGCPTAGPISLVLRDGIQRLQAEVARHQGQFAEALRASKQIHDDVQNRGCFTSYDEQADAAAEYAAALYDSHDFATAASLLRRWVEINHDGPLRSYYAPALEDLGQTPETVGAERFLTLIPYF